MRVAQLMRREPPAHTRREREPRRDPALLVANAIARTVGITCRQSESSAGWRLRPKASPTTTPLCGGIKRGVPMGLTRPRVPSPTTAPQGRTHRLQRQTAL